MILLFLNQSLVELLIKVLITILTVQQALIQPPYYFQDRLSVLSVR